MIERQELYCHNCGRYVQFDLDLEIDGNHVLECPNCSHEHCRVVRGGRIMGDRWDQRNGPAISIVGTVTVTMYSIMDTSTAGDWFLTAAWSSASTYAISW